MTGSQEMKGRRGKTSVVEGKSGTVANQSEAHHQEHTHTHVQPRPDVMLLLTLITLVILPVCANVCLGRQ